jgi:hypothetical protein
MLRNGSRSHCAQATLTRAPIRANAADVAVCSFVLSYVPDVAEAFSELARIASKVLVSDLHPAAEAACWKRSFRVATAMDRRKRLSHVGQALSPATMSYELDHLCHSIEELDRAAAAAGLKRRWRMEARFGEPERRFFVDAGKAADFDNACKIPAVLATLWERD